MTPLAKIIVGTLAWLWVGVALLCVWRWLMPRLVCLWRGEHDDKWVKGTLRVPVVAQCQVCRRRVPLHDAIVRRWR